MIKIRGFLIKDKERKQQIIATRETIFSGGISLETNIKLEEIYDSPGEDKARFYNNFYVKNKELFMKNPLFYWRECSRQYAERSDRRYSNIRISLVFDK